MLLPTAGVRLNKIGPEGEVLNIHVLKISLNPPLALVTKAEAGMLTVISAPSGRGLEKDMVTQCPAGFDAGDTVTFGPDTGMVSHRPPGAYTVMLPDPLPSVACVLYRNVTACPVAPVEFMAGWYEPGESPCAPAIRGTIRPAKAIRITIRYRAYDCPADLILMWVFIGLAFVNKAL